jgi:hypothetical protein
MHEADDNLVHNRATGEPSTPDERSMTDKGRTPKAYRICDGITEGLIYFGVVFTQWAFGTTQNWSI